MDNPAKDEGQSSFSNMATRTNPFASDGGASEFGTQFGTMAGTSAVSSVFGGGEYGQNRSRQILLVVLGLVLAAAAALFLLDDAGQSDDPFANLDNDAFNTPPIATTPTPAEQVNPNATGENLATDPLMAGGTAGMPMEAGAQQGELGVTDSPTFTEDGAQYADAGLAEAVDPYAESMAEPRAYTPAALVGPPDGALRRYDETSAKPEFTWTGDAQAIVFAYDPSMQQGRARIPIEGRTSYSMNHPHPGTWYWQVLSPAGNSEVRSFTIDAPVRRNVQVSTPVAGDVLAGNGGQVVWTGDRHVSTYRVELSSGDFGQPAYRFATVGTSVAVNGVAPGSYQMRVGAFSEVAGRWEYTQPVDVSVQ